MFTASVTLFTSLAADLWKTAISRVVFLSVDQYRSLRDQTGVLLKIHICKIWHVYRKAAIREGRRQLSLTTSAGNAC